nr:uncharacterized protein LOC125636886 isoform X2 [Caretta caretta]
MEQWRGAGPHQGLGGRKLSSPSCAPAVGIMISRDMMEKGHDQDTLQCRIKVKELWNAYCKACKANSCSSAAPLTCCFYKELDAILEGDPTSPPSTTMDASEPRSTRQEEEGDTLTSLAACSQELLSSQEEDATLRSQLSVLSLAERLQRIKKRPRRSKEDMLPEVMQQSLNEKSKSTGVAGEGKEGPPAECGSLAPKHGAAAKHYGARSGRDTEVSDDHGGAEPLDAGERCQLGDRSGSPTWVASAAGRCDGDCGLMADITTGLPTEYMVPGTGAGDLTCLGGEGGAVSAKRFAAASNASGMKGAITPCGSRPVSGAARTQLDSSQGRN